MRWLRKVEFANAIVRETLDEYLVTLDQLSDKVERLDKRIEEFSQMGNYAEKVKKLVCFKGIKTHTAMSLIVETSDFRRFPHASQYAAFLGLIPGERSSSDSCHRLSITKAGNSHIRRLLTEAANSYSLARAGRKSIDLKQRQQVNAPEVIAYADKANDRLRQKYVRIATRSRQISPRLPLRGNWPALYGV